MAWPTTGLLDDFNRANAGSLGANWTDSIDGGSGGWKIVSNQAEPTGSFGSSYWNVAQYGPNVEVYATRVDSVATPERFYMYARITATGASSTAYILRCSTSGSATTHGFEKNVAGVNSAIGADWTLTLAAGDGIGMEVTGTTLRAWRKPAAGAWAQMDVDHTDSSISAAGYIGIQGSQTLIQVDDFSGGTIVTAAVAAGGVVPMRISSQFVGPMALRHQFHRAYWPNSPTAVTTAQALTATVTTTATLARQINKLVTATATTTATVVRQAGKPLTATVTSTAVLVRRVNKPLTATVTTAATLASIKVILLALTATVTTVASMSRQVGKKVTATATTTASMVRQAGKQMTATVTTVAAVVKSVGKKATANATVTATLSAIKAVLLTLTATVTTTATMRRQVGKQLAATVTSTATLGRNVGKLMVATVTVSASIGRLVGKLLSAAVTAAGSIAKTLVGQGQQGSATILVETTGAVTLTVATSGVATLTVAETGHASITADPA